MKAPSLKTLRILAAAGVTAGILLLALQCRHLSRKLDAMSLQLSTIQQNVVQTQLDQQRALSTQEQTIRDALSQGASLFTGVETGLEARDGQAFLTVSLVPRALSPGEVLTLHLDDGAAVELTDAGNGRFTASLPCPLDQERIRPVVTIRGGGSTRSEALEALEPSTLAALDAYVEQWSTQDEVGTLSQSLQIGLSLQSIGTLDVVPAEVTAEIRIPYTESSVAAQRLARGQDDTWPLVVSAAALPSDTSELWAYLTVRTDTGLTLTAQDPLVIFGVSETGKDGRICFYPQSVDGQVLSLTWKG